MNAGAAFAECESTSAVYFTDQYTVEVESGTRINYDFIKPVDLSVESKAIGKIEVELTVCTYETMQKLGFTSLKVQRWNGSSWITDREETNQYDYSSDSFEYTQPFTGLSGGYTYRVKVTILARRVPGEVQNMTITSDSIICH
jgi:hypothetical protein